MLKSRTNEVDMYEPLYYVRQNNQAKPPTMEKRNNKISFIFYFVRETNSSDRKIMLFGSA